MLRRGMCRGASSLLRPVEIHLWDDPDEWRQAGFFVNANSSVRIGNQISLKLMGRTAKDGKFPPSWTWRHGNDGPAFKDVSSIGGILISPPFPGIYSGIAEREAHPNGVVNIDHIVIQSTNAQQTANALEDIGVPVLKRTSKVRPHLECVFLRPADGVVIEIIGPSPPVKDEDAKPARLWGITFVVDDIENASLAGVAKPPWQAVQPGRMITTLKKGAVDVSLAVAFMTPHVPVDKSLTNEEKEALFQERAEAQKRYKAKL